MNKLLALSIIGTKNTILIYCLFTDFLVIRRILLRRSVSIYYHALSIALFSSIDTGNISYNTFPHSFSFSDKRPGLLDFTCFHSSL